MQFLLENWVLLLAALSSGTLLLWPNLSSAGAGPSVSTSEAVRLMNHEKAALIDVCEPQEYAAGHAVGARNVPAQSLEGGVGLPSNKQLPLVVVCATGARAPRAAARLRKLGYANTHVLSGGLQAWRAANLPIEKA
jgi:rhodanese-related sulfurtransferase